MKEAGYSVNIMPISSSSVYYTKLQEALELDEGYDFESSEHLQYYLNENILEDIRDKASDTFNSAKKYVGRNVDNMKNAYQDTKSGIAKKYAALKKTISEKYAAAKKTTGEAKVALLKQIDKLKSAAATLKSKLPLVGK
jgi:hypothetical protein